MMHLLALATIGLLLAGAGALIRPRVRPILIGHLAIIFYAMQINGSPAVDILTSRNDNERTGANLQETILRADNVNPTRFGRLFSYPTKSDVYAQPLVASDIDIPGRGRRNVVFVANVSNDLFAFDADGPLKNEDGVLWQRNLGTPETIDDALGSAGDGNVRKHGDIGILSTPVIDRERGLIFLVSKKKRTPDRDSQGGRGADSTISQWLHAIDMATGGESRGSPVEIKATRLAIPNDANSRIDFNPRIEINARALQLQKTRSSSRGDRKWRTRSNTTDGLCPTGTMVPVSFRPVCC